MTASPPAARLPVSGSWPAATEMATATTGERYEKTTTRAVAARARAQYQRRWQENRDDAGGARARESGPPGAAQRSFMSSGKFDEKE